MVRFVICAMARTGPFIRFMPTTLMAPTMAIEAKRTKRMLSVRSGDTGMAG
ncbi:MAG TPA: hypothetical protein VFS88_07945 [Micavibrio sp.]|nr:hypothetical protein [Micavibrio sp.]